MLKHLPTAFLEKPTTRSWKFYQLHLGSKAPTRSWKKMEGFGSGIEGYWTGFYQLRFENDGEGGLFEEKDGVMGLLKGFLPTIFWKTWWAVRWVGCFRPLSRWWNDEHVFTDNNLTTTWALISVKEVWRWSIIPTINHVIFKNVTGFDVI